MQKYIHPEYKKLVIKIGKDVFHTMSCYKKDYYVMDRNFRQHPAWTKKGVSKMDSGSAVMKGYKKKYGNLDFLDEV